MSFLKNKFFILVLIIIVGGLTGLYLSKYVTSTKPANPQNVNPEKVGEMIQKLKGFTKE